MRIKRKSLLLLIAMMLIFSSAALFGEGLQLAAYNGDLERVKEILKGEFDPDERDSFGGTALHASMFQENMEIIELLINAGLDVNAQGTSNGYTPLHDAVWANNLEAAKLLIKNGALLDIKGNDGLTPYDKAVKENRKQFVKYFDSLKD
ncbi:MAG: ankyrin repeat domain-containing protein [Spirochaetales bacterium]|nr:ankyrin repeat domain-containing protein [Spirochaetales bacterium]